MFIETILDAKGAFKVIAAHFAGKRTELSIAIAQGRDINGWFRHEAIVALDNALQNDFSGREYSLLRGGLPNKASQAYAPDSMKHPLDLVFEDPEMVASLELFLPSTPIEDASDAIWRDLLELLRHPHDGFLIAGQLDFADGLSPDRREREGPTGAKWLTEAVRRGRDGIMLESLVASGPYLPAECLQIDLHPMEWTWPDGREVYRHAILTLGAWSVYKPS